MSGKSPTDRIREMLDERGVEYYANDEERCFDEEKTTTWSYESFGDDMTVTATEQVDGEGNPITDAEGNSYLVMDFHNSFTPEQAIAATLGSDRDEIYSAGFDNGVKATLQQLDGLLMKTDSAMEIQNWVDEQWKEYES